MSEKPSENLQAEPRTRWSALPPRTRLEDTVAVQETPPKAEVITSPVDVALEFAIRHA